MWYYAHNSEQKGPIGLERLKQLIREQKINAQTLMWKEGMEEWKPMHIADPFGEETFLDDIQATTTTSVTDGLPKLQCTQCGEYFPENQINRFRSLQICYCCKEDVWSRLLEGLGVKKNFNVSHIPGDKTTRKRRIKRPRP